jgi:transcriptional regulator with XRE-family HTH domain
MMAHINWHRWMRTLGEQERRIRCFLGLSQEELAHLAGVSQGSVSRLESGRGLATPMLVGAKVSAVLRRALQPWAPLLNDGLRRTVDRWAQVYPAPASEEPAHEDPRLQELLQLYEGLDQTQRGSYLAVLRATAAAMASASEKMK